ncbi:F-box/LRR-repeat protein 13-like [Neltuma alba]|uniref:F-box/LRR-repeat protein 13-like n=1 Tax=Neltuma alba TaxID=207710 RepID=UPI0010A3F599|nr:F-box/LRR-repeat protein 13-like [Prosopis alba]
MASAQISDLSDPVFEHILSFLPTNQAITTCLLSKRWRHLRLSLSSLDFDDFNFHNLHSFLQYVDTVMSMRDHSEILRKFYLILRSARGNVPRMKINTWINTSVNSRVEHVEIYDKTLNKFNIEIPSCIFNCNSIRILKLNGVKVTTPSFIHLPSLEVLHLSNVIFPNIQGVYNLLCGCPLLQDLSLKYCSAILIDGRSIVPIKEGSLRNLVSAHVYRYPFTLEERLTNLVLADVYRYPFTLRSLSNVTALRIDMVGYYILFLNIAVRLFVPLVFTI